MSFVYAEKVREIPGNQRVGRIQIYSDTRATLPDTGCASWGPKTKHLLEKYGFVKSYVLASNCCISFAGSNMNYANDFIEYFVERKVFQIDELIQKALEVHIEHNKEIEFIICIDGIDDDKSGTIFCVKDGQLNTDCENAWIGSEFAFRKLQELRVKAIENKTYNGVSGSLFRDAVNQCKDETVGGFTIVTSFSSECNRFCRNECWSSYVSKPEHVNAGDCISLYDTAADGGFAYHLYGTDDPNEVVIDFLQGDISVIYTTRYRSDQIVTDNKHARFLILPIVFRRSDGKIL